MAESTRCFRNRHKCCMESSIESYTERSSFLCHNHSFLPQHETRIFSVYLNNTEYKIAFFGKNFNEYNVFYVPSGWKEWVGLPKNSQFYKYTLCRNREKGKHGFDYSRDYLTDLIIYDNITFFRISIQCKPDYTELFCTYVLFNENGRV